MLTVAASQYTIDQNSPSAPYVLELDCPFDPTKSELEQAILKMADEELSKEVKSVNEEDGEDNALRPRVEYEDTYGDLCVSFEHPVFDDQFIFIGLPKHLKRMAKKFQRRTRNKPA